MARSGASNTSQTSRAITAEAEAVFLNIPYDNAFERLYLAYIVGLSALGLVPRATLGIPGGKRRLSRILELFGNCQYSIHDLSRVQLDRTAPSTPRFNMPFELGLAVAWSELNPRRHTWFVCETRECRALKSLSDLNGTDIQIHNGTVEGVMRELCNCFVAVGRQPDVPQMMSVYRALRRRLDQLKTLAGARSLYEARIFRDLSYAAAALSRDPMIALTGPKKR